MYGKQEEIEEKNVWYIGNGTCNHVRGLKNMFVELNE